MEYLPLFLFIWTAGSFLAFGIVCSVDFFKNRSVGSVIAIVLFWWLFILVYLIRVIFYELPISLWKFFHKGTL